MAVLRALAFSITRAWQDGPGIKLFINSGGYALALEKRTRVKSSNTTPSSQFHSLTTAVLCFVWREPTDKIEDVTHANGAGNASGDALLDLEPRNRFQQRTRRHKRSKEGDRQHAESQTIAPAVAGDPHVSRESGSPISSTGGPIRSPDEHAQQPPLKLKPLPQRRSSVDLLLDASWKTNIAEVSSPGIIDEIPTQEDGLASDINSAAVESDPYSSSLLTASTPTLHQEHPTHKTPVPSGLRDSSYGDEGGAASTSTLLPATPIFSISSEPLRDLTASPDLCRLIDFVIGYAAESATHKLQEQHAAASASTLSRKPQVTWSRPDLEDKLRFRHLTEFLSRNPDKVTTADCDLLLSATLYGYLQRGETTPVLVNTVSEKIIRDTFKVIKDSVVKAAERSSDAASAMEDTAPEDTSTAEQEQPANVQDQQMEDAAMRSSHRPQDPAVLALQQEILMRLLGRGVAVSPEIFIALMKAVALTGRAALLALRGVKGLPRGMRGVCTRAARGVARTLKASHKLLRDVANDPNHPETKTAPGVGVMMDKEQTPAFVGQPLLMDAYLRQVQQQEENPVFDDGPGPEPEIREPMSQFMRNILQRNLDEQSPRTPLQRPPQRFVVDQFRSNGAQTLLAEWAYHDFQQLGQVTATLHEDTLLLEVTVPQYTYMVAGAYENIDGQIYYVRQPDNPRRLQGYPLPFGAQQILQARQEALERLKRVEDVPALAAFFAHVQDWFSRQPQAPQWTQEILDTAEFEKLAAFLNSPFRPPGAASNLAVDPPSEHLPILEKEMLGKGRPRR